MRGRLLILLLAGLAAWPASAGLFNDDEARARADRVKAELDVVAQRVDDVVKNQVDLSNQLEAIRADIARIRGQVEVLGNGLDAAQKRQQDFYVDLDNRLRKLEALAADRPDAGRPADPEAESRDYEAALSAVKSKRFADAVVALTGFIKGYPKSAQLPSAHFWAGYGYAQLKEPAKAAEMYGAVAANWPNDAKAPDALLEQANNLEAAGDRKAAHDALKTLVDNYPASDAARKAKSRLKPAKKN